MAEPSRRYARFFPYLDRYVQLELRDDVLVRVSFPDDPEDDAGEDHPVLDRIGDYVTGTVSVDFHDVSVDLDPETEPGRILGAVRAIPYGESATVEDVAREIPDFDPDDEASLTTIREALFANPMPLIIPDHRVRDAPSAAPPRVEQRLRSVEQAGV